MPLDDTPSSDVRRRLSAARRSVRRGVLGRRRLLAAVCAALAVGLGLRAVAAPPPPTVEVPVAARALPAGKVLSDEDLTTVPLHPEAVPDDLLEAPAGRVLAGPVARGEPVTSLRVVGDALAREGLLGSDRVAVPVRMPDAGAVELLRLGDLVDLVATDPQGGTSEVVATAVPVVALPEEVEPSAGGGLGQPGGRLVVLGVRSGEVTTVSAAAASTFLTYTWTG